MRIFLLRLVFVLFVLIVSPAHANTSSNAEEATLRFTGMVELIKKGSWRNNTSPTQKEATDQINYQIQFLFGPMELGQQLGTLRAAPKESYSTKIKSISKKAGATDTWTIQYDYQGIIVVEKSPINRYDVFLPNNPDTIYDASKIGIAPNPKGKVISPCVDPMFPTRTEFWYFWSPAPAYKDCKLKVTDHYQRITGTLERHPPRYKTTYPDYTRLVDKGVVDIHMIFGKDDYHHGRDPYRSKDDSAKNYVTVRNEIASLGFTIRTWTMDEIKKIVPVDNVNEAPFVEEATKTYSNGKTSIRVRLFYGQTEIEVKGHRGFHYFLRDGVKNAAILIYDGHSGLGKASNLDEIEADQGSRFRFEFNKSKYQIFFFNSCSSFAYYNAQYFRRKRAKDDDGSHKGLHNLDMISNGLSTDWKPVPDLALVRAMDLYAEKNIWTSYQDLAKDFDTGNLNMIEGDEDNPRIPR